MKTIELLIDEEMLLRALQHLGTPELLKLFQKLDKRIGEWDFTHGARDFFNEQHRQGVANGELPAEPEHPAIARVRQLCKVNAAGDGTEEPSITVGSILHALDGAA
jgi:hypothetical protein